MRNGIPNLGALQAFEATARLGSFSRAGEELSLTHSTIFRQVQNLEERLGVQLFNRARRRIALTEAGEEYAARVRYHLEQLEKDTFGLVSRSGRGRSLHIAVLPTFATAWLVPRLPDFNALHGDVAISLSVRTLPFQFNDHPFDAAIYHAPQPWAGTRGIKLFDETQLVPVCNQSMKKAIGAGAGGFQGYTHLHMISRPDAWRSWYRQQNIVYEPSTSGGPRYELFTMTLAAAIAGLGVALMPEFLVRHALRDGSLVLAGSGVLSVSEGYYFSYPAENEPSETLRALETWLRGVVQSESSPDTA